MPNLITVHTGSGSTVHGTTGDDVFTVTGPGLAVMAGDDGNDVFNAVLGDVSEIAPWDENEQFVNGEGGVDSVNLEIHSAATATYSERASFTQTATGGYSAAIYMTGVDPNSGNTYHDQWMGDFHGSGLDDGLTGVAPTGTPTGFDYAVNVTTRDGDDGFALSGHTINAVNIDAGNGNDTVTYDVNIADVSVQIVNDGEAYINVAGRWDHVQNVETLAFAGGGTLGLYGDPGDNTYTVDTTRHTGYTINGGAGNDTVYFNNNWDSAFIFTNAAGVTTVQYPARYNHGVDQTDHFTNIEHLVFSDGHVVDLNVHVPLSLTITQTPRDVVEAGIDASGNDVPGIDTVVAQFDLKGDDSHYAMSGWTETATGSHVWTKAGTYGHATFTEATGALYYTIDNTLAATNALAAGASATESFTVGAQDPSHSTSQTVTVTIDGTNDRPALTGVQPTLGNGSEDVSYTVHVSDLLVGFSDPEGDTLSVQSLAANHGSLIDNHDGTFTLTPSADYNGQVMLSYLVSDGHGGQWNGWQYVTLDAVNDAPRLTVSQATLGHGSMNHDYVVTAVDLLTGFSDVEGDALSVHGLSADHGSVTDNHDGTFTVHPTIGYSGVITLSYSVEDSHGAATAAGQSATLDNTSGNHNPTAINHTASTTLNHAVTTTAAALLAGAADSDGDSLTVASVGPAAHGTVTLNASGNAVYTPFVSYAGADSYAYTLSDGHGGTATATVNVTVAGTTPSYTSGTSYRSGQTFDVSGDALGHTVAGSAYDDVIWGGTQADSLNGGGGNDVVHGGAGKDTVTGGAGYDRVYGEAGADTFAFSKADIADFSTNGGHYDEIMDFEGAGDGFHAGVGDLIRFNGFSNTSTLTLDTVKTAASADATAHYYIITDGAYSAEIIVHYAGSAVLKAGDYGFYP